MSTVAIIGIAVILLVWLARARSRSLEAESGLRGAADHDLLVRLPPRALLARCISAEDAAYVSRLHSPSLLRLLLQERRRLALLWLRQTRQEAGRLYRLHVQASGQAANLRPLAELMLLFQFASFLVVYQVLILVVWCYGPVRTQALVHSIQTLADLLASLAERIAGSIPADPVSEMRVGRGA